MPRDMGVEGVDVIDWGHAKEGKIEAGWGKGKKGGERKRTRKKGFLVVITSGGTLGRN